MDIIKTASAAKSASFNKTADTPGSPYRKGTGAMPAFPGRYTRLPGGVVKTAPRQLGYSQARPAAVSKGKDPVDINAQGIAVANENNAVNVANEAAAKSIANTQKGQNAALPRGTVWNNAKGGSTELASNAQITNGRVYDQAAARATSNARRNYQDKGVTTDGMGWWDRKLYNAARPLGETRFVDLRNPQQMADAVRGAGWSAAWQGFKAMLPGGKSPGEVFRERLQQELANQGVDEGTGQNRYRFQLQDYGVNVSKDDPLDKKPSEPNNITVDRRGNEQLAYQPKRHYADDEGYVAPTFNDYNHDVKTRSDSILQYYKVGAQPGSRNTDLEAKGQALIKGISDWRGNPALFNASTGWTQAAIDRVMQNPDFKDIFNAIKVMKPWQDPRQVAQLYLQNGASVLYTK